MSGLYAQVPYRDAPAMLEWLQRAFGMTVVMQWPDEDGGVMHAEVRLGDAVFTVFSDRAGYSRPEPRGESVGLGLAIVRDDAAEVDAAFRTAVAAGAEVVIEPTDTEWGNYRFRVRDPEGYEWTFGTYMPGEPQEWSEEEYASPT